MDCKMRARAVQLIVFDVDGVLTDGRIIVGPDGEMFKQFDVQDGLGISIARRAGLKTAIITGRRSSMVAQRSAELQITDVYQGAADKTAALEQLIGKHGLALSQIAYVGDDLIDLPVMCKVGFACAVANAVQEVRQHAHYISNRSGGRGAVREIIEFILQAQDQWQGIIESYTCAVPAGLKQ